MAETSNQFKIEGVRLEELEPVSVLNDETILLVGINKTCRVISLKSLREAFAGNPSSPDKDSVYYNATYIDNKFEAVGSSLTEMRQNITNLSNEVSTSIQTLNSKFDTLSTNLTNKIDSQINEVTSALDTKFNDFTTSTDTKIQNLNNTLTTKFNDLSTSTDTKIQNINNTLTDKSTEIDGKFASIESKINEIKQSGSSSSSEISGSVQALESKFNNYTTSTDQKIDNINNAMKTVVTKSKKISTNLPASGWVGDDKNPPFSITISVSGVTSSNNVEVLLPGTASLEQVEAWCDAGIVHGTQSNGSITLKGYNWKPEIDIPVEVIIRTDI